jgi:hypothetical protein
MPVNPVTPRGRMLDTYNPKNTCTHMVCHHVGFGGIQTLRSPSPAKPYTRWRKVKLIVYPFDRSRKRVAKCKYLLGCARLVTRNIQEQDLPQLSQRSTRSGSFEP